MRPRVKYWVFFLTLSLTSIGILVGTPVVLWVSFSPEEQDFGRQIVSRLVPIAVVGLCFLLWVIYKMVEHLFDQYVYPLHKLAEETQVISSVNPSHRIAPEGSDDVLGVTRVINELADKHLALQSDINNIIHRAKADIDEEKTRLSALLTQIPQGVVVCSVDGRILLYNDKAQSMLTSASQDGPGTPGEMVGLGRSIFGFLARSPIVHGLQYVQDGVASGSKSASFNFVSSRRAGQFLRITMAPVLGQQQLRDDELTGFVMALEDITAEIQASSRRDVFLQSLTISLQLELAKIRDGITEVFDGPTDGRQSGENVKNATRAIEEQIAQVAIQHAGRLDNGGPAEDILASDLLNFVYDAISEKYELQLESDVEDGLWLNVDSYTVLRGVIYLIGQLASCLDIKVVTLSINRDADKAVLAVRWQGPPVTAQTVAEWKECPMIVRGTSGATVPLESILEGQRGGLSEEATDSGGTMCVTFDLQLAQTASKWDRRFERTHRPVFCEFDLFQSAGETSELDDQPLAKLPFVVFDTETTGLNPSGGDEIISLGAIRIVNHRLLHHEIIDQLVNPQREISPESLKVHGISRSMVVDKPLITQVLPRFHRFAEGSVLVAHNASFDMRFLELKEKQSGIKFTQPVLDTLLLSAAVNPNQELHNLEDIAELLGIPVVGRHTALGDAIVTGEVLIKLIPLLRAKGINTLRDAREASAKTPFAQARF